jgi:hypothetical protein
MMMITSVMMSRRCRCCGELLFRDVDDFVTELMTATYWLVAVANAADFDE